MQRLLLVYLIAGLTACGSEDHMRGYSFFDDLDAGKIGSTLIVQPSAVQGEKGLWRKMLDITVPNERAAPLVVSVRSEYDNNNAANTGAPLVGFLLWGVGGANNQVEFDIPTSRIPDNIIPPLAPNSQPMNNIGGGVCVHISASHVSLNVRNDGNLSPLRGASVGGAPGADHIGTVMPARVMAFVSPGDTTRPNSLERTIWIAGGMVPGPPPTTPMPAGDVVQVNVPPFSSAVRCQRVAAGTSLRLDFLNNVGATYRTVDVPVNFEGPIPIDGNTERISVVNTSAVAISFLQLVFDVTPT